MRLMKIDLLPWVLWVICWMFQLVVLVVLMIKTQQKSNDKWVATIGNWIIWEIHRMAAGGVLLKGIIWRNNRFNPWHWGCIPTIPKWCLDCVHGIFGWWQLKHFLFSPLLTWGNDPIWRAYFSNGLVQPPTSICFRGYSYSSWLACAIKG